MLRRKKEVGQYFILFEQAVFLFCAYTLFSVFDVKPSPSDPLDWISPLGGLHMGITCYL